MKTGPYDAAVAAVSGFSNASGFGFGTKALRISSAVTSGAFGDQTFSPGVDPAGESSANNHFEASFSIGSTQAEQQPGLFLSVSPDDGNGGRMGYASFDDQSDGIHVVTYDVVDGGPVGTVASWIPFDVATISRTSAHTIKFVIDFVPGSANDVAKLYVDGNLVHTGTTWEDYYRYDPEQLGNGNVVPTTSKLLFREGGTAAAATAGNGYLIDNVSLLSSTVVPDSQEVSLYHVSGGSSDNVITSAPYEGHVTLVTPDGKNSLMIQGVIKGLEPSTKYVVWVRNLSGYTGPKIDKYLPLGYYALTSFTTNKNGGGNFNYKIDKSYLPVGQYSIQVAINTWPTIGITVAATQKYTTVVVGN